MKYTAVTMEEILLRTDHGDEDLAGYLVPNNCQEQAVVLHGLSSSPLVPRRLLTGAPGRRRCRNKSPAFQLLPKGNVNLFFCPEKAESPNINSSSVLAQEVVASTNEEACCKRGIEEAAK